MRNEVMISQTIMKSGSTFSAPNTWKIEVLDTHTTLIGPENDLSVYFVELPLTESPEKMAEIAWKQLNPHFSFKQSQALSYPGIGDWESMQQLIYEVPPSESKNIMAFVRIFQKQAYISLVDATIAAFNRRSADLQLMIESWKPRNFHEPNLQDQDAKAWTDADRDAFGKFIQWGMAELQVPSVAVAIVKRDGGIVFSHGYGATVDTPFMIGSTTKSLTTLMMGVLVDQQKLTWDTPVTEVLKDFSLGDEDLTQQLTARLAVSASTGLPRRDVDFIFNYSHITPEDRLAQMREMKPTTKLGETFQYSNLLFMAGGYMAAQAYAPSLNLEASYAQAMQQLVFEPLNMKNTVLQAKDALAKGAALPHVIGFDGQLQEIPLDLENAIYSVAPAGAVWSSARDMSQYLLAEMNNGVFNGKRVISEQALTERRKPGIRMGEKSFYGLGLMVSEEQGLQIISHGGATMGFSSDLFFCPEKGIGMVILANRHCAHLLLYAAKQKFLELTFGAKPQAEEIIKAAVLQQNAEVTKNQKDVSLLPEKLAWLYGFVGEYVNPLLGNAHLYPIEGGFEMAFKEWKSQIGTHTDEKDQQYLVPVSPPLHGAFKLQPVEQGNLLLDAGQEKYLFTAYKNKRMEDEAKKDSSLRLSR